LTLRTENKGECSP